jgi:peptidyl-prolyl cis-trans isomerase B (cyclophilin B)
MHVTLSQSFECSTNDPISLYAYRSLLLLGTMILLVSATACNRAEIEDEPVVDTPASVHFEWPDDPGHPTLTLVIEHDARDDADDDASRNASHGTDDGEGTAKGTIVIELMPELAPVTVARVIDIAKDGYYDGTTFHRVIPGFMIQGGDPNTRDRDPNNDGHGDPSTRLDDEFGDAPFVRGVVGMGNLGRRNSTGSQFFIMHADNRGLDGRYTVIGRVVSGIEVVDEITRVSIDRIGRWGPKDRPIENVVMKRVAIQEPAVETNRITGRTSDTRTDSEG